MSKQGKASRARNKARRKRERKARKEAQQAKYLRWKELGINTKSKRQVRKKRKGPKNSAPPQRVGWRTKHFLDKDGVPRGMPQWMWQEWKAA